MAREHGDLDMSVRAPGAGATTTKTARHVRTGARLRSPRVTDGEARADHGRRRVHRHHARRAARRGERGRRGRQSPPRRALGHRPLGAPELPFRRRRRARPASADRARRRVHAFRPCGGNRRGRHGPRQPRPHDARQRDRHLQRARGRCRNKRHARAPRRVLDQRGVRPTRIQRAGGAGHDHRLGRRGPLDVRGLEARGRAHVPRLPLRARGARGLGSALQHLRAGPDRRRRDPRVHRSGARWARPRDPRRRLADPCLVLRRRHGRGPAPRARASERGRGELQHRKPPLGGDDLRPRDPDQAPHGLPGEIRFVPLEYTDVELRIPNVEKARSLLGFEARVELDEGLERTIAWYRARLGAAA